MLYDRYGEGGQNLVQILNKAVFKDKAKELTTVYFLPLSFPSFFLSFILYALAMSQALHTHLQLMARFLHCYSGSLLCPPRITVL